MTLEQFIQTIQDITTQISLIKDKQKLSSDEKERLQGLEQRKVDISSMNTQDNTQML